MITLTAFRKMALKFPETVEAAHFDNISFKVKKKIFATYNPKEKRVCLKLSLADQDIFGLGNSDHIHPVPNKWGKMGWTLFYLEKVHPELLKDALTSAYCEVAPKKLAEPYKNYEL